MAGDFNKPSGSSLRTAFMQEIRDMFADAAKWFSGTSTANYPDGCMRYNAGTKKIEKYNLETTTWGDLDLSGQDVGKVDGCDAGVAANNVLKLNASAKALFSNIGRSVVVKTGNYTTTAADDVILVDASGGAVTITILAAATLGAGRRQRVMKIDSTTNAVTIDPNGSETINGNATYTITMPLMGVEYESDGSNLRTIDDSADKVTSSDILTDFVVSGLLGTDPGASLTMTIPSGIAYVMGRRVVKLAGSSDLMRTYTINKDTYVDISHIGAITYTEVANGAGAPSVAANSLRLEKVITSGTEITSVVDLRIQTAALTDTTGIVKMYAGVNAPNGYLICDGTAYSRTTYAALFAVLSTTYGLGDGSTTFNVPDLRGRVPIGVGTGTGDGASGTGLPAGGSALTAVSRGSWKGEQTHVLTVAELASHHHDSDYGASGGTGSRPYGINGTTTPTSNTGGSAPHNNIQPVMGLNFIIKY